MNWITELPKEEGYYITQYIGLNGNVDVRPIMWRKDVLYDYIRPEDTRIKIVYAWMPFPDWDDDNWNEIPYDDDWRDYCPTKDNEYIVKSTSGWEPLTRKSVHSQTYRDGHWRMWANKPLNPKYDFVNGWMDFPQPTDHEPIYDYNKGIGLNDKAKKSLKEFYENTRVFVSVGDREYREFFDDEKGIVRIPKEEVL